MLYGMIKFSELVKIGFAHHFTADKYSFSYKSSKKSFEIVYVTSGGIVAELDGEKMSAPEGSIFVLFRHIPIKISSFDGMPHAHCTVQAEVDYDFTLLKNSDPVKPNRILLPFVIPPSPETEEIKKELFSIVTDMTASREENSLSCSLRFCGIIQKLDKIARGNKEISYSHNSGIIYKIKRYIASKVSSDFSLSDISCELGFSESYLNHIFKERTGMSIKKYASKEKVKRITELIATHDTDFSTACANVGINDLNYGYRLFKKHMGVTPLQYAEKSRILKK